MGLFKKKQRLAVNELKCPAAGCSFSCDHPELLRKHVGWKHPDLAPNREKS